MNGRSCIDVYEIKEFFFLIYNCSIPSENHFKSKLLQALEADKVLSLLKIVALRFHNVLRDRMACIMNESETDCASIFVFH